MANGNKSIRSSLFVLSLCILLPLTALPQARAEMPSAKPYALSYVGDMRYHKALYEDTFIKVARDNDLGYVELRAANPYIDPWMPGEDTEIVLPTRHMLPDAPREGIVINLPEQRLYAFVTPGQQPVTHPIGVGREGLATPTGKTKVVRKKIGPVWRPTPRMREEDPSLPVQIGPGSDNPLGTHALYLGWPEYAIHGTNKPFGIGRRVSSGCIRMYPEDIVTFFDLIPEGTPVTVVDQPVKVGWIDNALYIEAHPSMAQSFDTEEDGKVHSYEFTPKDMAVLMHEAGVYADLIDWETVREVARTRRGIPVRIAEKPAQDHRGEAGEPHEGNRS
ncbi:MAG: L,D-transpeptidase family protein [Rhodospirillales bacterium]|nr:L,D-transpeptidase family protein [Rhodospirillales bacterium]MCB9996294.1 L,D-transpeptidase family protein [Rhodospirillales bacterium]